MNTENESQENDQFIIKMKNQTANKDPGRWLLQRYLPSNCEDLSLIPSIQAKNSGHRLESWLTLAEDLGTACSPRMVPL